MGVSRKTARGDTGTWAQVNMFVGLVIRSGAGPRRFLELTKSAYITPEPVAKIYLNGGLLE